jgi:hypothetical protein
MGQIDELVSRVDEVLARNKRTEWLLISCTALLFAVGIAAVVAALVSGRYIWSIPSVVTTFFLKWPLQHIQAIRRGNIALAMAPLLIRELPSAQAAKEIQKLIENLFKDTA